MANLPAEFTDTSQLDALLGTNPEGLYILNSQWEFIYVNELAAKIMGETADKLLGHSIWAQFPGAVGSRQYKLLHQAIERQETIQFETFNPHQASWYEVRAYPADIGLLVFFHDVTIPKHIQARLQNTRLNLLPWLDFRAESLPPNLEGTERELQAIIIRNMAEGVCLVRLSDWSILYANPKFEQMFGYEPGELNGLPVWRINYAGSPDDAQQVAEALTKLVEASGEATYEVHNVKKDGTPFWCRSTTSFFEHPIYGTTVVAVHQDITEQKQAEAARRQLQEHLRQSQEIYRILARNLPDTSVLIFDRNMRYLLAEGSGLVRDGYQPAEVEGRTIWEVLPPEKVGSLLPYYQAALAGIEHSFENQYRGRFQLVRALPLRNEQDEIFAGMLLTQDITEQKQNELGLVAEKERLDVTLRSIGDGIITTDLEGRVVLLNRVAEDLTGWSQVEASGRPIEEIFQIADEKTRQPLTNPVLHTISTGQAIPPADHTLLRNRNQNEHNIALSSAPIRDQQDWLIGGVLVFRDITQEQQLLKEQLKTSKLESLGILAGGIAHDFNNLLAAIIGNLELARLLIETANSDGIIDHEELLSFIQEVEKAAHRSRDITQQLLTFAKGGAPVKKATHLSQIIHDSAGFVLHGTNLVCDYKLSNELWPVEVDTGQVSQVIQNLVLNAVQAMPQGGQIEVGSENIRLETNQVAGLNAGDYVKLWVKDSGSGISPENLSKIFDPYFTTKPTGSGLGLAVCYSVVRKHEGIITVQSQPGQGSTFYIYLPASRDFKLTAETDPAPPTNGKGYILVMDDEDSLRQMFRRQLTRLGYKVELAAAGQEAIQLYEQARAGQQPFDLVFLDLTVRGGLGGRETMVRLHQLDPQVRAVICSGYAGDSIMADYAEYGFAGVLSKPFTVNELSDLLQNLVD